MNTMCHDHFELLQCSFQRKLCVALVCPEMMRERDLNQSGEE